MSRTKKTAPSPKQTPKPINGRNTAYAIERLADALSMSASALIEKALRDGAHTTAGAAGALTDLGNKTRPGEFGTFSPSGVRYRLRALGFEDVVVWKRPDQSIRIQ